MSHTNKARKKIWTNGRRNWETIAHYRNQVVSIQTVSHRWTPPQPLETVTVTIADLIGLTAAALAAAGYLSDDGAALIESEMNRQKTIEEDRQIRQLLTSAGWKGTLEWMRAHGWTETGALVQARRVKQDLEDEREERR